MYPVITCINDYLLISTLDKSCLLYKLNAVHTSSPPLVIESKLQTGKEVDIEAKGIVLHVAFSNTGNHIAICNDYKQLLLYSRNPQGGESSSEWQLVSTRSTAKKGVKIEFVTDDSSLVVADKLGVVTCYSVVEPEKEGVVILGHISVLLDCSFINSGAYLATADRDEKIRISSYPHTYDIQAFCLGHTKYVTCITEAEQWLLSGSGDGTVKLWEPMSGRLLSEIVCSENSSVIQQIAYIAEVKKVACLLNEYDKLVYVTLESEGSEVSFKTEVEEVELTAAAIAMCRYAGNSLIVLVDNKDKPLEWISVADNATRCLPSLSGISQDLKSQWTSLSGAIKYQREFYADVTKLDLQTIEQGGKKRKHEAACSNGSELKAEKC